MGYIHIALSAMKGDVAERQRGFKRRREEQKGERKEDEDENEGGGGIRNTPCE
jgi:hypothetical protein